MQRSYKLLLISLVLLNIYHWISFIEMEYGFPSVTKYVIALFVLVTLFYVKMSNPFKPIPPGSLYYPFIVLFTIYSLMLIIRACLKIDSLFYIQTMFGRRYFFLPYLIPLPLLFTKFDLNFFKNFFYWSYILLIPTILAGLFMIVTGLNSGNKEMKMETFYAFNLGGIFLILTAHMVKKKSVTYFSLAYALLMLVICLAHGRRTMFIEYLLFLFFMIVIRLKSNLVKSNDRMKMYFAGMLFIIIFLSFGYLLKSSYAFQRGFTKEGFQESRGGVTEAFFFDFHTTSDWVFGRGINGTVLRSIDLDNLDAYNRGWGEIEQGIMTILLRGGLLYTVPFIILLLRAGYLGFFKSNNDLTKGMAVFLLVYIIIMFGFNLPDFSSKYCFVWIFVSACCTPRIRHYTNEEISQVLNSRF